jgi:hypothetical protein
MLISSAVSGRWRRGVQAIDSIAVLVRNRLAAIDLIAVLVRRGIARMPSLARHYAVRIVLLSGEISDCVTTLLETH